MTAPDHATKPLRNTLRERGHPYMARACSPVHLTGGKPLLGKTSKMGQRDIRRLLIIGAMAVIRSASRKGRAEGSWLHRMLARKPRMVLAIALANKMARAIWAMLTRGEDYRVPAAAVR